MANIAQLSDPQRVFNELLCRDFTAFLSKAFPHIQGGDMLAWNWHLDAIAERLTRVRNGTTKRLLVTVPPRSLKSITISVAWVPWMLGQDPRLNFVCVSYSNELSAKLARDCLAIMQSHWYRELFPRTIVSSKRSASGDFETTRGGGRLATSITGTLTGRGGDIILIDDPIKPGDAMSETIRAGVNNWFSTTLASRLNDKQRGAIIVVMQRLHQHDLAGMLLEQGGWDELRLPAIATDDATIPLTRGRVYFRKAGEALHPQREPLVSLEETKARIGSMIFSAQYQQEPVPAQGNFVQPEWMKFYDEPPTKGIIIQSWDTASKDGVTNDYSVGITARYFQRRYYILDVARERLTFGNLRKRLIKLCRQYHPERLLIEDAASGTQLIQMLRENPLPHVPRPIKCRPEGDKISRFAAQASRIESGDVILPRNAPWLAEFLIEIVGFPNARYDDQADALAQLLRHGEIRQPLMGVGGLKVGPPR